MQVFIGRICIFSTGANVEYKCQINSLYCLLNIKLKAMYDICWLKASGSVFAKRRKILKTISVHSTSEEWAWINVTTLKFIGGAMDARTNHHDIKIIVNYVLLLYSVLLCLQTLA